MNVFKSFALVFVASLWCAKRLPPITKTPNLSPL